MISIFVDGLIIVLLIASLAYAFRVSQKLKRFSSIAAEIAPLVHEFSNAVDKSEKSVKESKKNLAETFANSGTHAQTGKSPISDPRSQSLSQSQSESDASTPFKKNLSQRDLIQSFFDDRHFEPIA
jgi:hypothetical protein